jgi:hypothetical protein
MIDEHGRTEHLTTSTAHRADCVFGSGFFRLTFGRWNVRYCDTWDEVQTTCRLLEGIVRDIRIERDGHCLDGDPMIGDANTPDVVDGIEAAVYRRDNRASQGGVRASIIIKRPGAKVTNVHV